MQVHDFFLQLMVILLSARILGELAARIQIPAVIGELAAGIILGPSLLGWISPSEPVKLLAEIGIVLLLFEVGLETDLSRLMKTGAKPFIVAFGGVVLPLGLGYWAAAHIFGLSTLAALFIGSTLTATSIGITMRVLSDLKQQKSPESQIVLGAAVLDDIIGVVLLALLFEFSSGSGVNLFNAGKVFIFIAIFMAAAPFAAQTLSVLIRRYDNVSAIPGLLPTCIVSLLLLFAWIAHAVGAPELLGGFAAGLALSPHFLQLFPFLPKTGELFAEKVHVEMRPIVHLFTPIFFVTVGLSLNLKEVDWHSATIWALSLSMLAIAIFGKLASGFMLLRDKPFTKLAVGIAMVPRGEVGLIFAEVGRSSGIFNQELYAAMIIVIAVTTLFAPIALRQLYANRT